MRAARPTRRALGALLLILLAGGLLVLSARASGPARFEPPTHAGVESYLSEGLGLRVEVGLARFDPWSLGLAVTEVRCAIGSWRIEIPKLVLRPEWAALLRGELRPVVTATSFVVHTAAADGASAARLVPELLESLRIPEAKLRLGGGELRTRRAELLLGSLAFSLDGRRGRAALQLRARQGRAGRLDAQGMLAPGGRGEIGVYLDGLATSDLPAWLGLALDPARTGLELPPLAGRASGRWHIGLAGSEETHHEFALDLRAAERSSGNARGAEADLRFEGRLALTGSGAGRRLRAGAFARVTGRAGRLHLGHAGGAGPLFVSGPFEVDVHPFGPAQDPFVVAELRFDEAHLGLPAGLRKPAGMPARVAVVHAPLPGEPEPTRFAVVLGGIEAQGSWSSDGHFSARSGWLPLEGAGALWPALAGRASGGRVRLAELRSGPPGAREVWQAELELAQAQWDGPRMPVPVHDLAGRLRLGPARVEALGLTGHLGGVPLRVDVSARRGERDVWRLRFHAEAPQIAVEAGPESSRSAGPVAAEGDLPAALAALAERQLGRLRDLGLSDRVEIERGVFRCARLHARGETLRRVEVDLALRELHLELARVSFEHAGRRRSFAGSIDLNPLLPDVRMAALD